MRNIIKRDGTVRPYEPEKIITAMGKAFRETAAGTSREEMERLLRAVEKEMEHKDGGWAVEDIQDAVERVLMENGRYEEAKRYILYRHRRNEQRAARRAMAQAAGVPALDGVLAKIEKDFPGEAYALTVLNTKFQSFVKPGMGADAALEALVKAAVDEPGGPALGIHRGAPAQCTVWPQPGGAAAQAGHRRLVRQAAPPDGRGAVRRIHPGALQPGRDRAGAEFSAAGAG